MHETGFGGGATRGIQIVDQSARSPALSMYVFVSASGMPVEFSGFFVDIDGRQISGLIVLPIGAQPVTFLSVLGETIPDEAYGFIGRLTGDVYFGMGAEQHTGAVAPDMVPGEKWPVILAADMIPIGRISI